METAAGAGETVESGEVALDAGSAARADPTASSEAVFVAQEMAVGTGAMVESGEVAVEADSPAEADEPAADQAVPAEMDAAAGSEEAIESPEVAVEADSATKADEPAARLDRPVAEPSVSALNDDSAANLRSAPAASDAREVSVPVTARVDLPKVRDLPQGRPEPQPTEPEVLAPGEPPTPFHVAETTQPQFDVDRLLDRGDQLLALGDVASARLFYRLAAKQGSAKGAMAMASTYDPVYLERIGFVGARPSPAEAIKWYRQAIDMGDRGAEVQLRELTNRLERAAALGDGEAQRILESTLN
jgi:TPR repeat protein